ncbi:MAG: glycoside hydrolase family 3 C-terminal domain-containing protein [Gemmatimonadota bacterium]|nr:MAG: glycoside hydrolase family 3 C-terminal domain-containing protein [Gemmatimonadota bacterium]
MIPWLKISSALACLIVTSSACGPQRDAYLFPYQDPDLPLEARVDDLVARMTLEEKVSQMLYDAPAIERLGIPEYNWWNEALHGVARAGRATVFPQAIGLAATWDTELMFRAATVISDEARAKYHESVRRDRRGIYEGLTFWSPNINIFRDPRWGRGMETYGEDPYLTGQLAVQFVNGLQGDDPRYFKTVATPKHFAVHSGPEPDRHTFDAVVSERDLRETYLPAFRATILDANAQSVMCAYNRFLGDPCCASNRLLQQILRDEWGFDGYVVSDCWAIRDIFATHRVVETAAEASAMSVVTGTDLNCGVSYDSLVVAVTEGLIDEADIDVAVKRLFRARFMLGMFDPAERVPYSSIPYDVNGSAENGELALEAARKSIVLLKNDGILPLDKGLGTIAVIGPNADDVDVLLGNYNGIPLEPITPLQGIRQAVSSGTQVLYARGSDLAENTPAFAVVPTAVLFAASDGERVSGLRGEYFEGREFEDDAVGSRVDSILDFNWWDGSPMAGVSEDGFAIRWRGTLVPPSSGDYSLGIRALGQVQLTLDNEPLVRFSNVHHELLQWRDVSLQAGQEYDISIEFRDIRTDANIQFLWSPPEPPPLAAAIEVARSADAVIMIMGLSPRLEGEEMPVAVPGFAGGDRTDLKIPAPQRELIEAVTAVGKPTVLILLNGSALAATWAAEHIPAIVEAWYPGQAAGTALADVIFGDYSPAGRLPITFYNSIDQLPPFTDYDMDGRTYRYFTGEPLFPFGHGLSYTTFEYSDLQFPASVPSGQDADVSVVVENSGSVAGEEVVQLYLTDVDASVPVPLRSLTGFERVSLQPGERKRVSFTITARQMSLIDDANRRVVEPGMFRLSVGGKQPGFSGVADAGTTEVVMGEFAVVGDEVEIVP